MGVEARPHTPHGPFGPRRPADWPWGPGPSLEFGPGDTTLNLGPDDWGAPPGTPAAIVQQRPEEPQVSEPPSPESEEGGDTGFVWAPGPGTMSARDSLSYYGWDPVIGFVGGLISDLFDLFNARGDKEFIRVPDVVEPSPTTTAPPETRFAQEEGGWREPVSP